MRWLGRLSSEHRTRLLSVAGAAVLVVLCGSASAVWLYPGHIPLLSKDDGSRLGVGAQPGASQSASAASSSPGPSASPGVAASASASTATITASYKTIALLGLGGFDTEVTVADPISAPWTVVLVMPEDKTIENRSPGTTKMVQQGTKVILTPLNKPGTTATFAVRFPALLALGKSVTSCTINGDPCTGI